MTRRQRDFESLLLPVRQSLFRFAIQLAGDPVRGEDLLQQATEAGLRKFSQLMEPRAFRVWMSRLVYRTHLNDHKRRSRRPEGQREDIDNVVPLPSRRPNPEDMAQASRIGERITEALDRLPAEQRRVVWLVDGEGFTYAEAATILEIRLGTAASRVARARLSLRTSLRDVAAEQGVIQ